jgi:hypothetical protein
MDPRIGRWITIIAIVRIIFNKLESKADDISTESGDMTVASFDVQPESADIELSKAAR